MGQCDTREEKPPEPFLLLFEVEGNWFWGSKYMKNKLNARKRELQGQGKKGNHNLMG